MAFIKDKDRDALVKKINKSYGFRKFWISLVIAALIAFIIVVWLIFTGVINSPIVQDNKLTTLGWGMVIFGFIVIAFGVVSLILTFTIKSPKQILAKVNKLESSAISGKKIKKTDSATSVAKDRKSTKYSRYIAKKSKK